MRRSDKEAAKSVRAFIPEKNYGKRSRDTEATCKRKVGFDTPEEAQLAADDMSKRDGTLTTYYKCKFCPKFHLSKEGVDVLDLPSTYKDQPVFFDERGPYLKTQVFCASCNKPEPATMRISVVDGQYTRTQGVVLDDPSKMKHPKAGSKTYVHVLGCPLEEKPAGAAPASTEPDAEPAAAPPAGSEPANSIAQGMTGFNMEVPFDEELLLELSVILDPVNRATYPAEFANGAAWFFNRTLMHRLAKMKEGR